MGKPTLDYVCSGMGLTRIMATRILEWDEQKKFKKFVIYLTKYMQKKLQEECSAYQPQLSCLFNGYTEYGFAKIFEYFDDLKCSGIYADSGGLQIVTAGKSVTEDIKLEIYKRQTYADYAMCFDVIPLENMSEIRSSTERTNIKNKLFNQAEHAKAGAATGQNIKKQCEIFRQANAKTKVLIIVQGNRPEDMILYFNEIAKQLDEKDYDHIAGIAVADTCIGNGYLESVDMLRAAKDIARTSHPSIHNQLHLLGVGAVNRMRPVIYLMNSGYLSDFKKVSFDSTVHSGGFIFGKVVMSSGIVQYGPQRTADLDDHFKNIYDFFKPILEHYVTLDEFYATIFASDGTWNTSDIKTRAFNYPPDSNKGVVGLGIGLLYTYYQIFDFMKKLNEVMQTEVEHSPIGCLLNVKTDEDMEQWFNTASKYVKTKRITRKEDHNTLESLFG